MSVENRLYMTVRALMSKLPGSNLAELEHPVTAMPGAHRWTEGSAVRFDLMKETKKRAKAVPAAPEAWNLWRRRRWRSRNRSGP